MIVIYDRNNSVQYHKTTITIVIDDPLALASVIKSDAPNCSVTYDRHYDDRNSFIIQATDHN